MAVVVDSERRVGLAGQSRSIRFADREVPVVGPVVRDPRLHLAVTTITILVIGIGWLDFRLSIPQVVLPIVACAAVDVARTYRRMGALVWPASAMQTATSTVLILRITGFEAGRWWSFTGWYYFVGIALAGLLSKYLIRLRGRHVFNPSNIALVVAFLVLGAERIEPLDFWWGPFGWAMLAAYLAILTGGITLCRRLRLLELAGAFYLTFVVGVGALALLGQSITTQWSLSPVSGAHFWWILVTSPETLVFVFFMITDPRTAPSGRWGRVVFGCCIGAMSTLLLAPWGTEFGAKVGLLAGLLCVTAARPFVEAWIVRRRERLAPAAASSEHGPTVAMRGLGSVPRVVTASLVFVAFIGAVSFASVPNRGTAAPTPAPTGFDIDPGSLPTVTVDREVRALSAELASPAGAQELAVALAFNLEVEAEAVRTRDPSLLSAVAHGKRLDDMTSSIERAGAADVAVPGYHFDSLHLTIVYPGGVQSGANAGLVATGTVTSTTYAATGAALHSTVEPVEIMFSLREFSTGRWLITDTPEVPVD